MDIDKLIEINLPEGFTYGYTGNCNFLNPSSLAFRDDRSWAIFKPHPGRVGLVSDSFGGWPTEYRFKLAQAMLTDRFKAWAAC